MAAVLELLLDGKVSAKSIISWLCHEDYSDESTKELCECSVPSEFLPFFINYLREQTAHLMYHGSSNAATPAKTPNSIHKLRRASLSNSKSKSNSVSRRGNRTQLFSPSPFKSDISADASFQSLDDSPVPMWDQTGSGSKQWKRNPFDKNSESGKGKRASPFRKEEQQVTLGEYLNKTDGHYHRGRRNRSPVAGHNQRDEQASSGHRRRSGGKSRSGNNDGSSQKARFKQQQPAGPLPVFSLNLEEFPSMDKPSPSTRSRSTPRRITPTAVTPSHTQSQMTVQTFDTPSYDSPAFQPSVQPPPGFPPLASPIPSSRITFTSSTISPRKQTSITSNPSSMRGLDKERELLRLERLKQGDYVPNISSSTPREIVPSTPPKQSLVPTKTPTKTPPARCGLFTVVESMLPSRDHVTFTEKLNLLANLYSACLQECLVSNIVVELYFLMQLLTAKGGVGDESDLNIGRDVEDINYLCTIHNCVYFAVTVLHKQLGLLSFLDQSTLRLLADNQGIGEFSPVLNSELEVLCDSCVPSSPFSAVSSPIQVVPFLADTDNRKNFPNDRAFHTFKKQRDKFYELVREWQAYHTKPGWRMKEAMSRKVKDLVHQTGEVANYTHFVRLFRSQLIRMCEGDLSVAVADSDDTADFGFLSQLKKKNPEKFKRLEERFSMPTSSGGPCPPPSFPGCQEFFKEFIVAADNYTFNQHLIDSFSSQILELNDMQFPVPEPDSNQPSAAIDEEQQESFTSCLHTLRVLAKFLGFVIFMPYQAENQLPEGILEEVILARNKSSLPIDVLMILKDSHQHCRLILTLPWVVEYLSMMDSVAPQLRHYQMVLKVMVQIYRMLSVKLSSRLAPYNVIMLLVLLGWFFEIPCIPASLYFTSFSEEFGSIDPSLGTDGNDLALDHLPWIDQQILYKCCPFLVDVRILLAQTALGVESRSTPIRKITPVAADTHSKSSIISTQHLQLELENNFFHNHSPSLKKTVEFICSRIASNCIKMIDASLVSDARKAIVVTVEELVSNSCHDESLSSSAKDILLQKARNKCVEMSGKTKEEAHQVAARYVESRCKAGLDVLLIDDISTQVQNTAKVIAIRLAMDRVTRWINTQVTAALQKELGTHFDKILKASQKAVKKDTKMVVDVPDVHRIEMCSPSDVIQILKDLLRYLLMHPSTHPINADHINAAIATVRTVLHYRQDLTPVGLQSIHSLTVELAAIISALKPCQLEQQFQCVIPQSSRLTNHTSDRTREQPSTNAPIPTELVEGMNKLELSSEVNNQCQNGLMSKENTTDFTNSGHNFDAAHYPNQSDTTDMSTTALMQPPHELSEHIEVTSYSLLEAFVKLWKDDTKGKVPANAFICAKNVVLMDKTEDVLMTWKCIDTIVQTLSDNALTTTQEIYDSLYTLMDSSYVFVSSHAAMLAVKLATQYCNTEQHCKKDADDDLSDMDKLLQKIADRCCEPVVLESIFNYYSSTKQSPSASTIQSQ